MSGRDWIALGAVMAGLSVALGALAAHGLDGFFAEKYAGAEPRKVAGVNVPAGQKYLADFKTAAEYQMTHALGIIGVGLLLGHRRNAFLSLAGIAFLVGILLFSGFLYTLTLTGQRWMGAIVPLGGVSFLVGWGAMAYGALSLKSADA